MPYGLSSSPSAFQKILSSILQGLKGAQNMMDDIVVHGKDQIEHDQRLERVLTKLSHYNVTLNADKCKFSADEVDFLSFRVSAQGIQPTTSNVRAILDLKEPTNRTELASFLGTTNFYLKCVQNYADKTEPLRKLLSKDTSGRPQQSSFNQLKADIASPPVLAHFDPDAETIVSTDASGIALGAVLSQVISGEERPIAFWSRTLTETQRKYSTGEREALGWSDRLHQYNFDVQYTSGKNNTVPDMLSRLVFNNLSQCEEVLSAEAELQVMSELCESLGKFVTPEELKHTSTEDTLLTQVRDFVTNGWLNKTPNGLEVYEKIKDELFIFNSACVGRGERAIIPESLQQRVLYMAHNGHPGIVKMKQKCCESVWWPGIDRQIEKFVKDCEACVLSEKSMKPVAAPAQFIPWPEKPWQQLQIDIFGEVQIAPRDKRFLVVVHDMHSKWPEIAATGTVTSKTIIDVFTNLFTRWGLPDIIMSDNGPQFCSYEFKQVWKYNTGRPLDTIRRAMVVLNASTESSKKA
ncbi:uncharacterized protein K02A2.6-like [Haliotis rufescens]|uniref:uncharacterized protein K02A2.6-like n=1 Tax=Haliotis rufescens TaxID=6454 RepID=UPI00201F01AF|nr:uncharacterized protein K02A2.6-like [Haliotis rufescens]